MKTMLIGQLKKQLAPFDDFTPVYLQIPSPANLDMSGETKSKPDKELGIAGVVTTNDGKLAILAE